MGIRTFKEQIDQSGLYNQEIAHFSFLTKDTHVVRILGEVGNQKVYLFESKNPNGILITAGWQGDEPAGWEACKVLCKEVPDCSFIPFVSPSCFMSRQHRNDYGENVDREWPNPITAEGQTLQRNMNLLLKLGKQALLSLQEDPHRSFAYSYSWKVSSNIKAAVKQTLSDYFPLLGNGTKDPPATDMFANHFVKSGCDMAIQLETPADGTQPISKRTECQIDCCKAFIALI